MTSGEERSDGRALPDGEGVPHGDDAALGESTGHGEHVAQGEETMEARALAAETAGPPTVYPPADDDTELARVLERAAGLYPPLEPLPVDAPVFGDHVLNPDLAPSADTPPPRHAAVLVALAADDMGRLSLILTERATHLKAHAGQIALPGGRIEPGEKPAEAALREAEEEIALPRHAVEPIGLVDAYVTRSGFFVVPVLARLRETVRLVPEPGEVAAAFTMPFGFALSDANRRERTMERNGATRRYYETMYGRHRIWGVTAGILKLVSERLDIR